MSIPSQAALTHLRAIKPNDGWSVKRETNGRFQLLRRNAPLSDRTFLDIHYDSERKWVVGVLNIEGSSCQVLVDERGKPVAGSKIVAVTNYDPNSAQNINFSQARAATNAPTTRNNTAATNAQLTPEQNQQLFKYALIVVGTLMILNILSNTDLGALYLVFVLLLVCYMIQTCPSMNSFDAKKELKRVLRGENLPENHPDKPKGFLEGLAARVAASVTAELATLPGYEVTMTPFGGVFILSDVRVPTAKIQCFWVGAFGKWYYVTSREIRDRHYD